MHMQDIGIRYTMTQFDSTHKAWFDIRRQTMTPTKLIMLVYVNRHVLTQLPVNTNNDSMVVFNII